MNAGASSKGTVITRGRSDERPLVILVGGAFPHGAGDPVAARLTEHVTVVHYDRRPRGDSGDRAPSPAGREAGELEALIDGAGSVVLVFGAGPGGVLAVDGPLIRRLAMGEPALRVDDGSRPSLPEESVAQLAALVSADRQGDAVEHCMPQAAGLPAEAVGNVFCREGEYWTVRYDGSVVRLKDTEGLRQLARLLAHPGREFHATDLEAAEGQAARAAPAGSRERAAGAELAVRPDLGDAGELLDATAKANYKARLDDLRAELEEAERFNDPVRTANARAERDFLVGELARAVGLGGRDRRAASHAERARLNATRAIRTAMTNLTRANPALGRHLAATVRTGRYCSYCPDPRVPIVWNADPPRPPALGANNRARRLNAT
jgi:hypothetical protein